jgi:hemoglobin/transferrin/lactoferrin receptor protein
MTTQPDPRGSRNRRAVAALGALCVLGAPTASAQTAGTVDVDDTHASTQQLPEVQVKSRRLNPAPSVQADAIRSTTTIGAQALQERQPDSVFQMMDEVAGVGVQGGPRNSGMSFNIRGYTDGEDVRVELDGVAKGFEKYRFGGTFIEPELLKAIEVRRGAQIESGAGALGGTVSARTKDAADLLRPGQSWGARTRVGHATNNSETHAFVSVYGRPSERSDVVIARSRRTSNDIALPDGSRLPLSATDAGSSLLKGSWWASDSLKLQASWIAFQDQGLQAYDTTGGQPGAFGQTQRRIQDETLSLQAHWLDEASGREWKTTLGRSRTQVRDHMAKGWSVFSVSAPVDDDIAHDHQTLDTRLTLPLMRSAEADPTDARPSNAGDRPSASGWRLSLHLGLQQGHSERASRRVTGNTAINQALYPDGNNPAQPPGSKDSTGAYAQLALQHGRWQVLPGLRWDRITSRVEGANALLLQQAGQSDRISAARSSPSLTLAHELVPQRWTLFGTWAQAFRPPLLDEAFMRASYGPCNNASLLRLSDGGVPGYARTAQVAPRSGICADFFEPESSRSLQAGVHARLPGVAGPRSALQAKLTAFNDRTAHLLETLMAEPGGSGRLTQPGTEHRWGLELESSLQVEAFSVRLSGHRMQGRTFDGLAERDLLTVPADRLLLALGWQQPWGDIGLRWQQVWARRYFTDNTRRATARQAGHRLLGVTARWQLQPQLSLDVAADNLANTPHQLDNGFGGPGTDGPGRNVRIALSARY